MLLDMNGIIYALSYALDEVESELVGATVKHSKRVAYLSYLIGKSYGMNFEQLSDLTCCAAMHDNALTQYNESNGDRGTDPSTFGLHCTYGQNNLKSFPFHGDVTGFITYHHENADGSGLFHKKEGETPFQAQIIHLADMVDVNCNLSVITLENYDRIMKYVNDNTGTMFAEDLIRHFYEIFSIESFLSIKEHDEDHLLSENLPHEKRDYSFEQIKNAMDVFGKIVDYKSSFTKNHSFQVASKALIMARYYNFDEITAERYYIAGILHDIGKMAISNDILEKPDKLSDDEFVYMKTHAWFTYIILRQIDGFEDITEWASCHHEKLNGKGYPFGRTADKLSSKDRLMACIDIYQALSEDRPYKKGMSHEKCISIMKNMAEQGLIDSEITADIDNVFRLTAL